MKRSFAYDFLDLLTQLLIFNNHLWFLTLSHKPDPINTEWVDVHFADLGMCTKTQEQILVESLFEHYKPEVRPVCNASDAVDVSLKLRITKVDELVGTGMLCCDKLLF